MKKDSLITTDLLENVLESVYLKHEHPRLVDYEEAVAQLKNEKLEVIGCPYTKRSVHTSVHRSMKELVEKGDVIKEGKYYYGRLEYEDYCGKQDFRKYIYPISYDFVPMSENVVAIKLAQAENHDAINHAVIRRLGEKKVYASFICDNVLTIVFYKDAFDYDCCTDLVSAISDAYRYNVLKEKNA